MVSDSGLARLEREWLELFALSGTRNPFAHPTCVRVWLRHFAPNDEQRVVVTARREGQLVAVAPFAYRAHRAGPVRARSLELVGAGVARADCVTEMTEVLLAPEGRRRTLRALVRHLTLDRPTDWDWLAITLPPTHGWFENEWLPDAWLDRGQRALHRATLPFVVMPLPGSWEELPLKRNMKEAIRRSRNRLTASHPSHEVVFADGASATAAFSRLQELHRQRAGMTGDRARIDLLANDVTSRFARDLTSALAGVGNATVAQLQVDGEPVAARLVLRANDGVFFPVSGSSPDDWHLGAPTTVIAACVRRAIERGDKLVNFSLVPDAAKLRWSEHLELHNEFVLAAPTRSARHRFAAYWQLRAARSLRGR